LRDADRPTGSSILTDRRSVAIAPLRIAGRLYRTNNPLTIPGPAKSLHLLRELGTHVNSLNYQWKATQTIVEIQLPGAKMPVRTQTRSK